MLSGFNTNIRHRTVLFHVQSEDSGLDHPHIITHLYHGGTILASEKSTYAERLQEANLLDLVKELMEKQHKVVLKRLVGGDFDDLIRERLGADVFGGADETEPPAPDSSGASTRPVSVEAELPPEAEGSDRAFGEGIVSEKPLDEVILDYLVANARKRKRRGA